MRDLPPFEFDVGRLRGRRGENKLALAHPTDERSDNVPVDVRRFPRVVRRQDVWPAWR